MHLALAGVELVMFADDLAIIVKGTDITTMEKTMNEALQKLSTWVTENEMVVNLDKTKFQLFSMKNNTRKPKLIYNQDDVKETNSQRYLGIILDQRLTFRLHINEVCEKAENCLKILNHLGSIDGYTQNNIQNLHYTSLMFRRRAVSLC